MVVLDDLHWAEPAFLDLVEHLVSRSAAVPILVVALAREDLLEDRPGFMDDAARLTLGSLSAAETEALLDSLGGSAVAAEQRVRILEAAEGNPLYLEQLLALAVEAGIGSERPLPATIHALLAARLDRLGPGELSLLERAAVVGREFTRDALGELLAPEGAPTADRHLEALAAREFLKPDVDGTFRFHHVLLQEAAYRMTPKSERAELHEHLAEWLEGPDELRGYHLERAYRLRVELGEGDAATQRLALEAGRRLGDAGVRALKRGDTSATSTCSSARRRSSRPTTSGGRSCSASSASRSGRRATPRAPRERSRRSRPANRGSSCGRG